MTEASRFRMPSTLRSPLPPIPKSSDIFPPLPSGEVLLSASTPSPAASLANVITLPTRIAVSRPGFSLPEVQAPRGSELVAQILQHLITTPDPSQLCQTLATLLEERFSANLVCIAAYGDRTASAFTQVSPEPLRAVLPEIRGKLATLTANLPPGLLWVTAVQTPCWDGATPSLAGLLWEMGQATGASETLSLITAYQGQVNGMVALFRDSTQPWKMEEAQALREITEAIALAIHHIQHHRHQQILQAYQALTGDLTLAMQQATNLDPIVALALAGISEIFGIDRVWLVRLRKTVSTQLKASLSHTYCRQKSASVPSNLAHAAGVTETLTYAIADCPLSQAAVDCCPQALVIPHLGNWQAEKALSPLAIDPATSLVILPLVSKNNSTSDMILGLLVLQQPFPHFWSATQIQLAEHLANQLSTAILQIQTLQQVQAVVEERTAQLQRSLDVQAKLYEKTRQQLAQLHHLNQLKDEFLSTISHELRTPLTSMRLAIQMLQQANLSPQQQQRYLDILEKQCVQESGLVNDLLALQELETQTTTLQFEWVDLKPLIAALVQRFEPIYEERGLRLAVRWSAGDLQVKTDLESLRRILVELLTNASKYATPQTNVVLQIYAPPAPQPQAQTWDQPSTLPEMPHLSLRVTNLGTALDREERSHIFEKFRRGRGVTQQAIQGTGLGLALVKTLVQYLNGEIQVASETIDPQQLDLRDLTPLSPTQDLEAALAAGTLAKICFTLTLPWMHSGDPQPPQLDTATPLPGDNRVG